MLAERLRYLDATVATELIERLSEVGRVVTELRQSLNR
jgi:hypothetical protein